GQLRGPDLAAHRPWTAALDAIALTGDDDDRFVAEAGAGTKLGFHIGPYAAALRGVKSADVNNPHRPASSRESGPTSSEAFLMRKRCRLAAKCRGDPAPAPRAPLRFAPL